MLKVAGDALQGLADWIGAGDALKELIAGGKSEGVKNYLLKIKAEIYKALENNNTLDSKLYDEIMSLRNMMSGLSSHSKLILNDKISKIEKTRKQLSNNRSKYSAYDLQIDQAMNKTDNETLGDWADEASKPKNWFKGGVMSEKLKEAEQVGDDIDNNIKDLTKLERNVNQ